MKLKDAASIFQVFDVAFFIPGIALLVVLLRNHSGCDGVMELLLDAKGPSAIGTAFLILGGIAATYILGLICHALQRLGYRLMRWILGRPRSDDSTWDAWYLVMSDDRREGMIVYWWYMRATAWNLAVALCIGSIVSPGWIERLTLVSGAALMIFLGLDFQRAFRNSASTSAQRAANGVSEGGRDAE